VNFIADTVSCAEHWIGGGDGGESGDGGGGIKGGGL